MMRRPKNGFDDGQRQPRPPPPSEPQKKKKEPVQAFSNVTTPMSDCSPSDRPMSDFSSIEEKTSPVLGRVIETVRLPDSAQIVGTSHLKASIDSINVDATPTNSKSEDYEVSEETESTEEESDIDDNEHSLKLPINKQAPPSIGPGVIYFDEKDKLQSCDPTTGAVTFWRNTAPLPGPANPRLFSNPRWIGLVPDEGMPSAWPPPEPPTETVMGPVPPPILDAYAHTLNNVVDEAMDHPRIREVDDKADRMWPDLAFVRINDLDRALSDMAARLVMQAAHLNAKNSKPPDVEFLEKRVQKTNAFVGELGKKGVSIGQEFETVANNFGDIAYILDTVRKITESPDYGSVSSQNDLKNLHAELRSQCQELKTRLIELKGAIGDYSVTISSFMDDAKNCETTRTNPKDPYYDDYAEDHLHRAAFPCVKELKEDLETDTKIDNTGVFKRWYEQSRLRAMMDSVEKESTDGVKAADRIDFVKKLPKPKPPAIAAKPTTHLRNGHFGKMPYSIYGYGGMMSNADDDDKFDFYSAPERVPVHQSPMMSGGHASQNWFDPKSTPKPMPKPGEPEEKFDFYSAPEPNVDI